MTDTAFERILDALRGNNATIRETRPGQAQAQCPAHDDGTPSLAITGIEGQALVHCHAGCATPDVLAALNLTTADLYDTRRGADYRYDNGRVVHRKLDKQFPQSNTDRPAELYRLGKVRETVAAGQPVYVVEGEKDVHALESVGAVATCSPMGAGKWSKVDPSPLHGATVLIVADQDNPGRKHAADVAASLAGKCASVSTFAPKDGNDAADHIAAGYGLDEFLPVLDGGAETGAGAKPATGRRMALTAADTIKPRRVQWGWTGRLALGTLALLAGREGLGKSTVALWIAARLTRGELPGEHAGHPKAVLVCATEDSWEHTIVPRLMAAGADLTLVYRVEMLNADDIHLGLSLPADLRQLEAAARDTGAALLILDPLMSRLGDNLDTHKDGEVRLALEPLVAVADRTGMTVLGLMHHNKSGSSDPLQLVMASKAFTAVARSVHTVIPDPDDDTGSRLLFGTPKNNLGRSDLPTLAFTVVGHPIETDDGTAWTGRVEWGDEVSESIAETMRRAAESSDDRSATSEAADWLGDYLTSQGGRAASADIKAAGLKEGHAYHVLKRARRKLGVTVENVGFPRHSYWVSQSGQQSEQPARGEFLTVLTVPTGQTGHQSGQWEQSEQSEHPPGGTVPTGQTCGHPPEFWNGDDCGACALDRREAARKRATS